MDYVRVAHAGREVMFVPRSATGKSIGTFLRRGEFYESAMLEYVRLLQIGGSYVDAGAAVGTHTLFFAALCESDAVVAFEPRDWVFELLSENIRVNGLGDKVRAHRVGLASDVGSVSRWLDGRDATFDTATLDSFGLTDVGLIKIDVEGMETSVVRGAAETLRSSSPVLLIEAATKPAYEELCAELRGHGYRPTGRRFNATPTFEFWPGANRPLRRRLKPLADAAYRQVAHPRRHPGHDAFTTPPPDSPLRRVATLVDGRAPWLGRRLRRAYRRLF